MKRTGSMAPCPGASGSEKSYGEVGYRVRFTRASCFAEGLRFDPAWDYPFGVTFAGLVDRTKTGPLQSSSGTVLNRYVNRADTTAVHAGDCTPKVELKRKAVDKR